MPTESESTEKSPAGWVPLLAAAVTLILWASAFVGIRHLGHTFSPGALSLGRLAFGSLALGLALIGRRWVRPTSRQWLMLVAIGVLWFGIYNVALNEGERHIDAGTAAMLIQLSPVLIALLAVIFLHERLNRFLVAGMVLAFGGVALIAVAGSNGGSGSSDVWGVLLCVLSALVYSISLILQKPLVATISPLQVTWVACTVGMIVCLPFAGQLWTQGQAASWADIGWLAYLGVFPTAIAFTTYALALRWMSASSLGVTTYLVPPITALISWVFLSEVPPLVTWIGGALCLAGVALTRRKPRPKIVAEQPATPAG